MVNPTNAQAKHNAGCNNKLHAKHNSPHYEAQQRYNPASNQFTANAPHLNNAHIEGGVDDEPNIERDNRAHI